MSRYAFQPAGGLKRSRRPIRTAALVADLGTFAAGTLLTLGGWKAEMKTKLLHESAGERVYALVLETGDEAMACLQAFAQQERISAAQITGIGALSSATLNYFDWEQK